MTNIKLRCQELDDNGKRCSNVAKYVRYFHGEGENFDLTWIRVAVCSKHLNVNIESKYYGGKIKVNDFIIEGKHEIK